MNCAVTLPIVASLMVFSAAGQHRSLATVAPGTVLRWQAPGTTSCHLLGRSWPASGETCLYPIDLLLPQGQLELARTVDGTVESTWVTISAYPYPVQELTVPPSTVDLSPENQARYQREARRITRLWRRESPTRFSLPLAPPLVPLPAGRSFGNRRVLNGQPRSPHSGVDYSAARGTPVYAAAAGQVVLAENHFFSGNSVFLDHGGGLITMYFHLEHMAVTAGSEIERGQQVGTVGATGRATGPHLHFGVRWHGARIDPTVLLGPVEQLQRLDARKK